VTVPETPAPPPPEVEPEAAPVPALGEAVELVAERFGPEAVLCVIVFDAASLAEIESQHGSKAYAGVVDLFEKRFFGLAGPLLKPDDVLARGEIGRSEYALLMLRGYGSALVERELPSLAQRLLRGVERQGQRIVYPFRRRFPPLPAGCAVALRNPRLSARTQVRNALEEARRDADLNRRIQQRESRRRFLSVLLEQRVQSVYEPIVCTHTLTVYGYEALARGPEGTEYGAAAALFEAAAEHDMLYELDALCRAAALDGASGFPAGTKLFMNIRPSAINDPRFHPSALIRTLERSHLKPSDVVFEISEQESIDNYSVFREARDKYGQLGFQFALDDTGAGYASLEAAMELAPEFIKVDRSFMKGIDEDAGRQAMVRGFQQVARSVGARIIGEGLDRLEELQKLAELGIEFGQGWLFGRATPMRAKAR
jgi:EAL domain-containing protein (putative c-di-GMP-specific phosphodiesterase class I)